MSAEVGDVVGGRYLLTGVLGQGGMGRVLRARDQVLGRDVAVKLLRLDVGSDPAAADRLRREAQRAAQVRHQNVVGVHDALLDGDQPAVVLELVEGPSLAEVVPPGGFEVEDAVWLLAGIADGLQAVHAAGLVHRDVTPANVLLDGGVPRVTDFGIARDLGATATQTTTVRGSVAYLAPEQVEGDGVGPATDLYALGCVAHHLLVGSPPFRGDTAAATVALHLTSPAPPLASRREDVPAHVAALVDQLLEKDPADRPASAGAAAAALRDPRRSAGTRTLPAAAAAAPTEVLASGGGGGTGGGGAPRSATRDDERSLVRRQRGPSAGTVLLVLLAIALAVLAALVLDGRVALPTVGGSAGPGATAAPSSAATTPATGEPTTPASAAPSTPATTAPPAPEEGDEGEDGEETAGDDVAAAARSAAGTLAGLRDQLLDASGDGRLAPDTYNKVDGDVARALERVEDAASSGDDAEEAGEELDKAADELDKAVEELDRAVERDRADAAYAAELTGTLRDTGGALRTAAAQDG